MIYIKYLSGLQLDNEADKEFYKNAIHGFELYHDIFGNCPKNVVDIGSHVGSLACHAIANGAKNVVAVEASKRNFDNLVVNRGLVKSKYNRFCNISCYNKAIYSIAGKQIDFYSFPFSTGQGAIGYNTGLGTTEEIVETIDLSQLIFLIKINFNTFGVIDLLKIDIEGGEFDAFPMNDITRNFLKNVKFLDLELHSFNNHNYFNNDKFMEEHPDFRDSHDNNGMLKYIDFIKSCGFTDNIYVMPEKYGGWIKSKNYNFLK